MAYRCLNESHWPMDFVSNGCFDLCGYHREEIESKRVLWGDFTHPDDIDEVDRLVSRAANNRIPFEVEYRIVTKNGEIKWVWERGRVVDETNDGTAILEGFITDITSKKMSENALIHAEAYAQAIVESAAEAVITINKDGQIESFNRAAQTIFGYSLVEIFHANCAQLVPPSQRYEFELALNSHRATRTLAGIEFEVTGLKKTGEEFPINYSIAKIEAVEEDKYVMLIRDLSRQRKNERELREQRELLAHTDRLNTLGEMAAGIAHEINQPLTAISMRAQSGLRFLKNTEPNLLRVEEGLNMISSQAHRAGAVIQRIQLMARRQEYRRRESIDPSLLIREIHEFAQLEAQSRDFRIRLNLCSSPLNVFCDTVQIQQVVLNLLRNGMDSMSAANCQRNTEIVVQTECYQRTVKISVIDCGTGVSDELAEQLYEPFRSTKDFGMGIGLSISRSIITAHESKLSFSNNATSGATFFFTLMGVTEPRQ